MEILLQIVNILLTVAAAVAVGVSPVLVHMAVKYLNRKLDANIKEDDEYLINRAVSNGIDYAEEWAAARVKAGGNKPTSADKEAAALRFVVESIDRAGLVEPSDAWLTARIKAALAASSFGATGKALLLPLLLAAVLAVGCSGPGGTWTRDDTKFTAKVGSSTVCFGAALLCQQFGGQLCIDLIKMGCAVGGTVLDKYLAQWAPSDRGSPLAPPELVRAAVATAFSAEPVLMQYQARVVTMGAPPVAPAPRPIGFTTPGAGADSAPVQPHD